MKVDWYWSLIFIMMMTIIGFLLFDNMVSTFIFGIVVGGIFNWIFASKKTKKVISKV